MSIATTSLITYSRSCGYCGRENSEIAIFCFECGTHLDQNSEDTEILGRAAKAVAKPVIALLGAMASGCLVWASLRDIIIGSHGGVSFGEFIVFWLPVFLYTVGYLVYTLLPHSVFNRIYPKRARRWLLDYLALWAIFILLLSVVLLVVAAFDK